MNTDSINNLMLFWSLAYWSRLPNPAVLSSLETLKCSHAELAGTPTVMKLGVLWQNII